MRDVVAAKSCIGIATNQPKNVSLFAREAIFPFFEGSMEELKDRIAEDNDQS